MENVTLDWEGIEWTRIEICPAEGAGRMFKCDGCSNVVAKADRYTALDPDGWRVYARWCVDCIEVAKAGR